MKFDKWTESRFLFFIVVVFCEVTANAGLVNTEPLLVGEYRVRFLWASGHCRFINPSMHNLVSCVFLLKATALLNVHCWCINIEFTASSTILKIRSLCNTSFLHKAHHSLLVLRSTRKHLIAILGGQFIEKNHQQKAQKCRRHSTKRTEERTLVFSMRAETRRQSSFLLDISQKCMYQVAHFFTLCACGWMAPRALWVLILGLQIKLSKEVN